MTHKTITEIKLEVYKLFEVNDTKQLKEKLNGLNTNVFSKLNLSYKKSWEYILNVLPEYTIKVNANALTNKNRVAYERNNHSNFFFYCSEEEYIRKVKQINDYLGYIPTYNTCSKYKFLKEYNKEQIAVRC